MRFRINHILALFTLLCLGVQSCEKNTRIPMERSKDAVQVTLRVTAGEESALTRTVSETDRVGSGYENYIDVDKLHILFFNKATDVFMEEFKPTAVTPVDDSEYPQVWELKGQILNPPVYGFKVVVLANWRGDIELTPGTTTIEELCKASWAMCDDIRFPMTPSKEVTIPMYGIKTLDDSFIFRKNIVNNIGQIDLLRSISKIIVRADASVTQTLESVVLKKFNTGIACAPLGMYVITYNLPYDSSVHLYNNNTDNTVVDDLIFSHSDDGKVWTVYVPEYRNANPETGLKREDCASIEVKFTGIDKRYSLDFRDYSVDDNGKRFNIVRNHIYDYTIKSISAYDADVTLVAQPWEVTSFDIDYTNTVGAREEGKIKWIDGNHREIGLDNKVIATTAGLLQCTFTISSPLGATWYAVFEEKSGDLNHFKFGGGDFSKGTDHASGIVDGNEVKLTIMQNPETVGSAKLVIYARYGNVNFDTSVALGGPYLLIKD